MDGGSHRSGPSELFQRQIHVDFWCESVGVRQRHQVGMNNIMWESDYPAFDVDVSGIVGIRRPRPGDVPKDERKQLLYGNAMRLYKL